MNTQLQAFTLSTESLPKVVSFISMLRDNLGDQIKHLDKDIIDRFSPEVTEASPLVFRGSMQWVYCSPVGAIIATLLKACAILPNQSVRHAPFKFEIGLDDGQLLKQRSYYLGNDKKFQFRSLFSDTPTLHEEFGGGIGMYLALAVKNGALLFRDRGYFLRLGRFRLPLFKWLTVGSFDLLHRNIDARRFQILIRVAHPLLGTLFYQRGEFEKIL